MWSKNLERVRFIKPMALAAVKQVGSYSVSTSKAWDKMFSWLDQEDYLETAAQGFGLFHDDPRTTPKNELQYSAAVQVPKSWEPTNSNDVDAMRFDGGVYVVTNHVGPYLKLGHVVSTLRDTWMPQHGLVFDKARAVLIIYKSDVRYVSEPEQRAEVCIPVFADRRSNPRT